MSLSYEEIISGVRELKNKRKALQERNNTLEKTIKKLMVITKTDNYGNLLKRIEKWERVIAEKKIDWFIVPPEWKLLDNDKQVIKLAREKTLKCLEKLESSASKDEIKQLIEAELSSFSKHFRETREFCF